MDLLWKGGNCKLMRRQLLAGKLAPCSSAAPHYYGSCTQRDVDMPSALRWRYAST